MADNNDEQYLDDLLNSLRTSNDDGSEALNDDKDNKDKPSEDTVENNSAVDENTAAQEKVDSADKPQENDDIFALEENESEAVQPPSEDDSKEDSADEDVEDDSLMKLFNQINGDSTEEHNEAPSSNVQEESASDESEDNPPDDILTITDDLDETPDDGSQEQDNQEQSADEQDALEQNAENVEQEKSEPVDMKKDEESEKPMSSKEAKAEAARAAKEAKAAAAKAAKEAKAAEKERKKAEKKAKKEQKKAERAAKKNKKQEEEPSEQPVVDAATQENADLINGLFDDSPAFGGASDDELASIPERDAEEPEKPKKKKKEKKKKEPKPKKPKAPKVKKEKRPPLPSELVKVTPGTFIGMIITIVVIVGTVYVGTKLVSYNITVNQAKEHFYNGKFDQAFDAISGINIKDSDKDTYYGIRAVASVYVDYTSYINYKKVGMNFEALDSLIKGLLHYDEYYSEAEKYDVLVQYDDVKQIILTELSKYGISEDDAIRYSNLESEQQYKEILSDIGGVTE